ncbi:hypothetical protein BIY23_00440 [Wolbachia pipientis]|uniref:Dicarboxylate/amino acid:cation symporter n=1 Tax=Wolbachia pipientis TaxID=955 RepID=A0A1E7QKG3_WOLPI|nr:cation:dicarboxylase symporter family transporter [Wolbachia pipientis]OEY86958.1 hypothetical protein BIY23_00440 [Wolbachia pipientis]
MIVLLTIITSVIFLGHLVPVNITTLLYSVSFIIKEILLYVMPLIVFVLIFSSINNLKKLAIKFIIFIIMAIFLSNLISSITAYCIGHFVAHNMYLEYNVAQHIETIIPLWPLKLKPPISSLQALICGLFTSMIISTFFPKKSKELSYKMLDLTLFILKAFLTPIIPIFVLGFTLKMQHDQVLTTLFKDYSIVFIIIISAMYCYIFLLYGLASSFRIKGWIVSMGNMAPAFITAISTMSSSVTMPFTLKASKKNVKQDDIVSSVIPITVNFHLVGDCFFIIILATMMTSSYAADHIAFISYFLLYMFAIAAVPGGGIIVMLPILKQYLQFSPEMLSLIVALYMIFDPIITSANVMGNGAFAMVFTKLYKRLCPS